MINQAFRIQTIAERHVFKKDVMDLFCGRQHGHMGHWEYSDPLFTGDPVQGTKEWQSFLDDHPEYYVIAREIDLANRFETVASHYGRFKAVVDLGPGSEFAVANKSFAVIDTLPHANRYIPIDVSNDYLKAACVYAKTKGLECSAREGDFFAEHPVYTNTQGDNPHLFMMWGGTHSNIHGNPRNGVPFRQMVGQLNAIRCMMGPKDRFIVSQDTNQNFVEVEAAYAGQSDFARTILHRIERDLNPEGDFDKDAFEFGVKWFPQSCSLAHIFTVKRDMHFSIDGEDVHLKKGQKLYFNNSYKFPEQGFTAMVETAGFKATDIPLYDQTGTMALHQLRPV